MGFVENPDDLDYDLDHVVLRVRDPALSAQGLAQLGFDRRNGVAAVADKVVRFEGGGREEGERPLLNHLAVLVDSAAAVQREAEEKGWEIAECPGGDAQLQRLVFDRLDADLHWLESLGAPVTERDTDNPRTTGRRFDVEGLVAALTRAAGAPRFLSALRELPANGTPTVLAT